jgi:4-amino-4-deoxy-L-arabinose transferase-like glycosyltransferase
MARPAVSTPQIYRLLVIALLVALTAPRMIQRGMFGDGVMHATIARNLSIGVGSFWSPTFTATAHRRYVEHPPLGFALQAVAFRLFGDHPAVERVYSLIAFAATALLMAALWRRLQPAAYDWLPLLLWLLPSIVTWAVVNNMLENTQVVFTTAAVLFLVLGWRARLPSAAVGWSAGAGLLVVAATLTKGPVGLFPLAVPAALVLLPAGVESVSTSSRLRRAATMAASMFGVVAGAALLLSFYGPSRDALTAYLRQQVIASLQGEREVNADPLATVRHLGLGIAARMAVVCGVLWLFGRHGTLPQRGAPAVVFLGVALAASLPIAISPKLVGAYFLPSVPLFALGFASLTITPASTLMGHEPGWHRRVPAALAVLLLAATVVVPAVRGPLEKRDTDLLAELDAIGPAFPRDRTIGSCRESIVDWRLHGYVNRLFRVSLAGEGGPHNEWFLQTSGDCPVPAVCLPAARGETLTLYRCPVRASRR